MRPILHIIRRDKRHHSSTGTIAIGEDEDCRSATREAPLSCKSLRQRYRQIFRIALEPAEASTCLCLNALNITASRCFLLFRCIGAALRTLSGVTESLCPHRT
jgi:hypothetical protein